MTSFSLSVPGSAMGPSLLERSRLSAAPAAGAAPAASALQSQVDGLVGGFVHETTKIQTLVALTGAGLAYRATRLGVMGLGSSAGGLSLLTRGASVGLGLVGESAVFTSINRGFNHLHSVPSHQTFGEEWLHSTVTLGALKSAGYLGRGQNLLTRHLMADLGMVSGHHLAYHAGLQPRPQGSLAEQFLHAEALNWQLAAGMSMVHRLAPGLGATERAMDLGLGSGGSFRLPPLPGREPAWAEASGGTRGRRTEAASDPIGPTILQSVKHEEGDFLPERNSDIRHVHTEGGSQVHAPSSRDASLEETAFLREARYHPPKTQNFDEMIEDGSLNLEKLAGYARAEARAETVGINLRVVLKVPRKGSEDYAPYGGGNVERMREDPRRVHSLTPKWERALVASPGTAILGLGAANVDSNYVLRSEIGDPIMGGKDVMFVISAGVFAERQCWNTIFEPEQMKALEGLRSGREEQARVWRAVDFARYVRGVAANYGFINVEDAQGKDLPLIFGLLESLKGQTAVWDDDRQGTGTIAAGGTLSWAHLTNRLDSETRMPSIRGVIFGAGAGGLGVYEELLNHGVRPENILVVDSKGPLFEGRRDLSSDPSKSFMAERIPEGTTVDGFAQDADFVFNLGSMRTFTRDPAWTRRFIGNLAPKPLVGAMTNPEPGLTPEMLQSIRPDAYYASGNQEYENTFNNFTAFSYVGAGVLMGRAGWVTPDMTVAAARGIFEVAKLGPPSGAFRDRLPRERQEFGRHWLVPTPTDLRLIRQEAGAVARAAVRTGVSILYPAENAATADALIDQQIRVREGDVEEMRSQLKPQGERYLLRRYPDRYAPFTLREDEEPLYEVAPEIRRDHFERFAHSLWLLEAQWQPYLTEQGEVHPQALTRALEALKTATLQNNESGQRAFEELKLITQIASVSPSLGLALAIRKSHWISSEGSDTIFHDPVVRRTVFTLIPEAEAAVSRIFPINHGNDSAETPR